MIKCIIFDIGGVLVENKVENLWESVNKKIGKKIFTWNRELVNFHRGIPDESVFYNKLGKRHGISPILLHNLAVSEYRKNVRIKKDVLAIAKALKKNGYKTAILSNLTPEFKRVNLRRGLFFGFSPVILSCDVGCKKPQKKIYRIAVEKTRTRPEESVYIDDKMEFAEVAKSIGMKTILFKNAEQLKRDLIKLGVRL